MQPQNEELLSRGLNWRPSLDPEKEVHNTVGTIPRPKTHVVVTAPSGTLEHRQVLLSRKLSSRFGFVSLLRLNWLAKRSCAPKLVFAKGMFFLAVGTTCLRLQDRS